MNKNDRGFCLTNLTDIIDICGHKRISKLDIERIYVKAGSIYDVLKDTSKKIKKIKWTGYYKNVKRFPNDI